jgi:hypothetical protein
MSKPTKAADFLDRHDLERLALVGDAIVQRHALSRRLLDLRQLWQVQLDRIRQKPGIATETPPASPSPVAPADAV